MALGQHVDHTLQVPFKANDDLVTSPKAHNLIVLQLALATIYATCTSFLRALMMRTSLQYYIDWRVECL